jgi:hypothetical protein
MYVRKTQTLITDIEHEVYKMQQSAISKLTSENNVEIGTPLHAEIKTAIENTLWQLAPDLKDKMPKEWLSDETHVMVDFPSDEHRTVRYNFGSQTGDELKIPPHFRRWDDIHISQKYWTPLIQEWLSSQHNAEVERQKIVDSYHTISSQLTSFMAKHASLNTALKEMPELELYVPNSYIEKVNKKEERVKATPSVPTTHDDTEVDVEALTRAAIAHRVSTASE